jgi:beta-lactamase class A
VRAPPGAAANDDGAGAPIANACATTSHAAVATLAPNVHWTPLFTPPARARAQGLAARPLQPGARRGCLDRGVGHGMGGTSLRRAVTDAAEGAGALTIAVAAYDFEHRTGWSIDGERWYHAASTIKIPILVGVFDAIARGRLALHSRVHVRNRFLSVADGTPYRVQSNRDANSAVHAAIGSTMQIGELARHMIVTSSNLATNLLFDLIGVDALSETLARHGWTGIELRRGVEDEKAWEAGISNRVTADGLAGLLRAIAAREAVSAEASEAMLDILHDQQFRGGIPQGLPDGTRVAHKTGEISTVAHDAGIVYPDDRAPYVLVVLTEWEPGTDGRNRLIADVSRLVHRHMTDGDDVGERDA